MVGFQVAFFCLVRLHCLSCVFLWCCFFCLNFSQMIFFVRAVFFHFLLLSNSIHNALGTFWMYWTFRQLFVKFSNQIKKYQNSNTINQVQKMNKHPLILFKIFEIAKKNSKSKQNKNFNIQSISWKSAVNWIKMECNFRRPHRIS